jgi:hypothetical protein
MYAKTWGILHQLHKMNKKTEISKNTTDEKFREAYFALMCC